MNTRCYELCIRGLRETEGRIKVATLQSVLDALVKTAARTTRMLANGTGRERGRRPKWLEAVVDFTIIGLKSSSTILELEAPCLGAAADANFSRQCLGQDAPNPDDTALDLAAKAILEARSSNPMGLYFDSYVLDAILAFGNVVGSHDLRYELTTRDDGNERFVLDGHNLAGVSGRRNKILNPQVSNLRGRLHEIGDGGRRFRLYISGDSQVLGRLESSAATASNLEALHTLRGAQASVEGTVHFKINGEPRFIEARRISAFDQGNDVRYKIATPDAVAVGVAEPGVKRRFGFLAGEISVPEDFDRMGSVGMEALFEGGE